MPVPALTMAPSKGINAAIIERGAKNMPRPVTTRPIPRKRKIQVANELPSCASPNIFSMLKVPMESLLMVFPLEVRYRSKVSPLTLAMILI